jgi:hypothetical protein
MELGLAAQDAEHEFVNALQSPSARHSEIIETTRNAFIITITIWKMKISFCATTCMSGQSEDETAFDQNSQNQKY